MTFDIIIPVAGFFIILVTLYLAFSSTKKNPTQTTKQKNNKFTVYNTPNLNSFSLDFTALAKEKKIDPVIGRNDEIRRLTQVLIRRNKNNAILIGDPGVGKTAIVEGFAVCIANGDVPDVLQNKRVLALEVAKLLSDTKYRGEFEKRIRKILDEIRDANRSIILFIDEVHSIVQSHGTEGSVNFADILKPALARGELQMIGATTTDEYIQYIKSNPSLERRFQPIEIPEPSVEETIQILHGIQDKYRTYHKVEFTEAALTAAAEITQKKVTSRTLPDKAIDVIDEAAAMVKVSHIHETIPALLYQAAIQAHPEVAQLWKKMQDLDIQISKTKNSVQAKKLVLARETLEKKLEKKGIVTVDTGDINKIIAEWTKN